MSIYNVTKYQLSDETFQIYICIYIYVYVYIYIYIHTQIDRLTDRQTVKQCYHFATLYGGRRGILNTLFKIPIIFCD